MSTVQAFNGLLKSFMEELARVFPGETQIGTFLAGFDTLVALSPRGPLDMFMDALEPHAQLVAARDPALFERLRLPGGIDFGRMWNEDGVTDGTREAIWSYLESLVILGTTVRGLPEDMLRGIESLAKSCAEQMESGGLDLSSLGSMLMNGALGNLTAGLAVNRDDDDQIEVPGEGPSARPARSVGGARRPAGRPAKRPHAAK